MSTLLGGCNPNVSFTLTGQVGTDPAGTVPEVMSLLGQFAAGSGADQVARIHAKTYVFLASTPQTPDLTSLLDLQGVSFGFSVVRWLLYRIQSTNPAHLLTVGGAGATEWNGWLTSGSTMFWYPSSAANSGYMIMQAPSATGMPVNSGSKLFKMDPGANAVGPVDLILVGS